MARIRSVKPDYWHDRKLARSCSRDARMLYIGLWNQADEWSRCNGDPAVIKGQVFPYDDVDVATLLGELVAARRVLPYEVDGDPFLFLPKLGDHQRLDTAKVASKFPAPPADIEEQPTSQVTAFPDSSEKTVAESESPAAPSALLYGTGSMEQGTCSSDPGPDREDVEQLCTRLADRIAGNGEKRPNITRKWRTDARLLLDRDERPLDEALRLIDWAHRHKFWHTVVLSMPSFREKYGQMRLQALAARAGPAQVGYTDADRDRPAAMMTGNEWAEGA